MKAIEKLREETRLAEARRELASFTGAARLDVMCAGREYILLWSGITESRGGLILRTDSWARYVEVAREFLKYDAIRPIERRRRLLEPARKPAGRAVNLQVPPKTALHPHRPGA